VLRRRAVLPPRMVQSMALHVGGPELALVAFATAIIFAILGPRLWRDMRARMKTPDRS
jgi:hypothetical protein